MLILNFWPAFSCDRPMCDGGFKPCEPESSPY